MIEIISLLLDVFSVGLLIVLFDLIKDMDSKDKEDDQMNTIEGVPVTLLETIEEYSTDVRTHNARMIFEADIHLTNLIRSREDELLFNGIIDNKVHCLGFESYDNRHVVFKVILRC